MMNGKRLEKVGEFYYLEYWFKYNKRQELNVQRMGRAGKMMRTVWGIGETRFKNEWKK